MRILISGATGLVGTAIVQHLGAVGHLAVPLVRRAVRAGESAVSWDPACGLLNDADLEGFDAIVHLGGESVAAPRWTRAKMERIRASRVDSTRLLAEAIAKLRSPPKAFLCASATGYYGHRGDEPLTEASPVGLGFFPDVCTAWEGAADPARGVARTCHLRFGIILAAHGGPLVPMVRATKFGLAATLGDGRQWVSWITLDDAVRAIAHVLTTPALEGPVNFTSPTPVRQKEFNGTLAATLHRPAILRVPTAMLLSGRTADEMLLASAQVTPRRLTDTGFTFEDPHLRPALKRLLVPR
jgi:uncharacterized protein (TIGR01777 family)